MSAKDDVIRDPLKNYSPEMREKLENHSSTINGINSMYDRGFTVDKIIEKIGVRYEVVKRVIDRRNENRRDRGPTQEEIDDAKSK